MRAVRHKKAGPSLDKMTIIIIFFRRQGNVVFSPRKKGKKVASFMREEKLYRNKTTCR